MLRYRERLRDDQGRQNRIEAVGEDLFTIAATALYAGNQEHKYGRPESWELADEFYRQAKLRVEHHLRELLSNTDHRSSAIGQRALRGCYAWLSDGIIRRGLADYVPRRKN